MLLMRTILTDDGKRVSIGAPYDPKIETLLKGRVGSRIACTVVCTRVGATQTPVIKGTLVGVRRKR